MPVTQDDAKKAAQAELNKINAKLEDIRDELAYQDFLARIKVERIKQGVLCRLN